MPQQKYVIGFDYPHLDFVDLYIFDENKRLVTSRKGGDQLNFAERYRPHRTINFPLAFPESGSQILLFRIETQSSLQAGIRVQTLEHLTRLPRRRMKLPLLRNYPGDVHLEHLCPHPKRQLLPYRYLLSFGRSDEPQRYALSICAPRTTRGK